MSRKGSPYDNALMENYKKKAIHDANFTSIDQVQMKIFKYIETYYKTKRIHSALVYQFLKDFESSYS